MRKVKITVKTMALKTLLSANNGASAEHKVLESLIANQLEQRAIARAAKDFARADAIRDSLTAAGVVIEDCAQGSSWHLS